MKITFFRTNLYDVLFLVVVSQFLILFANPVKAQTSLAIDSTVSVSNFSSKLDALIDVYGSLRFKAGASFGGEFGIRDQSSRLGLKLHTDRKSVV